MSRSRASRRLVFSLFLSVFVRSSSAAFKSLGLQEQMVKRAAKVKLLEEKTLGLA